MKRPLFFLLLIVSNVRGAETGPKVPARDVPASLAPFVEQEDGVPCLPKYINRIRILADGTAVLTTWMDPEKRQGRDPDRKIIWIRGETARDPTLGHPDTVGRPKLIDALGRCWYQPSGTLKQTCYVMVQEKEIRRFELDGLGRHAAFETTPGQVWIETYAGFTTIDATGKASDFRFCERGQTPMAQRDRQIYGTYGMVRHCDGSLLLFPKEVGSLAEPGEKGGWHNIDWDRDVWAWYLAGGDVARAKRVPLPRRVVGNVAPLPDGGFRLELYSQGKRQPEVLRWHPAGRPAQDPWVKASRVQCIPVHGSDDCYVTVQIKEPPEPTAVLQRFNAKGRVEVLHNALPMDSEQKQKPARDPVDDLIPSLGLEEGITAVALPGGGLLFPQGHNRGGFGTPTEWMCSLLVKNGSGLLFPLIPESSRTFGTIRPQPTPVYDLDAEGRLYYFHWKRGRLIILINTSRAPFPVQGPDAR